MTQRAFESIDTDGSGDISVRELAKALRQGGVDVGTAGAIKLMQKVRGDRPSSRLFPS